MFSREIEITTTDNEELKVYINAYWVTIKRANGERIKFEAKTGGEWLTPRHQLIVAAIEQLEKAICASL